MLANEEHWPKVCKNHFPPVFPSPFSPFVPFSWYIGRPPKYNAVLGFGALTPTSPQSSHPDSPENEKTETTFTFPAPVQPVSLPSPTSTDVSNSGACTLSESSPGKAIVLYCLLARLILPR